MACKIVKVTAGHTELRHQAKPHRSKGGKIARRGCGGPNSQPANHTQLLLQGPRGLQQETCPGKAPFHLNEYHSQEIKLLFTTQLVHQLQGGFAH